MVLVPPDLPAQAPRADSAAPLAEHARASASPGSPTDLPARLEHVVRRSIEQADHILGLPLDRERPQYAAELRAKTAVINTTLATQARVDELRLKRQTGQDLLPALLAELREAAEKNPKLLTHLDGWPAPQASASNASATPTLDRPLLTDSTAQGGVSEPLAHDDDEAAALVRLAAEAAELIAALKALYTETGCRSLDEELARARELVKIKAASEGCEVAERALRAAETDVCRHYWR